MKKICAWGYCFFIILHYAWLLRGWRISWLLIGVVYPHLSYQSIGSVGDTFSVNFLIKKRETEGKKHMSRICIQYYKPYRSKNWDAFYLNFFYKITNFVENLEIGLTRNKFYKEPHNKNQHILILKTWFDRKNNQNFSWSLAEKKNNFATRDFTKMRNFPAIFTTLLLTLLDTAQSFSSPSLISTYCNRTETCQIIIGGAVECSLQYGCQCRPYHVALKQLGFLREECLPIATKGTSSPCKHDEQCVAGRPNTYINWRTYSSLVQQ